MNAKILHMDQTKLLISYIKCSLRKKESKLENNTNKSKIDLILK